MKRMKLILVLARGWWPSATLPVEILTLLRRKGPLDCSRILHLFPSLDERWQPENLFHNVSAKVTAAAFTVSPVIGCSCAPIISHMAVKSGSRYTSEKIFPISLTSSSGIPLREGSGNRRVLLMMNFVHWCQIHYFSSCCPLLFKSLTIWVFALLIEQRRGSCWVSERCEKVREHHFGNQCRNGAIGCHLMDGHV